MVVGKKTVGCIKMVAKRERTGGRSNKVRARSYPGANDVSTMIDTDNLQELNTCWSFPDQ